MKRPATIVLFMLGLACAMGIATADSAHAAFGSIDGNALGMLGMAGLGMAVLGMACAPVELGMSVRGKKCPDASAPRNWVKIDVLDASRTVLGNMTQVRWAGAKARDNQGRHGYFRAFAIRGSVEITAGAANDAVSAYQLRSLISQFSLTDVSGHKYWAAAELRSVIDDAYYRHGRIPSALGGAIAANVGAGTITRDITTEIPLVSRAVGASLIEGLIPVAALSMYTGDAMEFTINSALRANGGGAPTGLTVDGVLRPDGSDGLEIWGDIVYIAEREPGVPPVIDSPWAVRSYTLQGLNQVLQGSNKKHSYAHVRYLPEDTFNQPGGVTGQQLAAALDGVTLEVGGQVHMQALNIADLASRSQEFKLGGTTGFGDSADALGIAALTLPAEAAVTTPDMYGLAWRPTEDAPAGGVVVQFATQPCTDTRWLHRTVGCDTEERAMAIVKAMGCGCNVSVQQNSPQGVDAALPKLLVKG